ETQQVRGAGVGGGAQSGNLQFADGEKAVIGDAVHGEVLKVEDARPFGVDLPPRIAPTDGNAFADQAIKVAIVLEQGSGEIVLGKLGNGIFDGIRGQLRVEAKEGAAKVAGKDHFAGVSAAQGSGEAEGLLVPRVDALPAEVLFEVPGEGGLHQAVFAIDAGDHAVL